MRELRLSWALSGTGWADCTVTDHEAETTIVASYATAAPEYLLSAKPGLADSGSPGTAMGRAYPSR